MIVVLLLSGSAQAATLSVCRSGCDYSGIQAAIDAANPSDTIEIQSGGYDERVSINKDVQLNCIGGAVSVTSIFTCGREVSGTIIAIQRSDGCNSDAFKGSKIANSQITVGGKKQLNTNAQDDVLHSGSIPETKQPRFTIPAIAYGLEGSDFSANGTLLYSDDFSNINSGWPTRSPGPQKSIVGYKDGRYQIAVFQKDIVTIACPPPKFTDFAMEVEATLDWNSDEREYGVLMRLMNEDNYYRFVITSDGYYGFFKRLNGKWIGLIPGTNSNAIHTGMNGMAKNIIEVECKKDSFTFYVNRVKLGEYIDNSFESGKIGLEATAYGDGGVQASFDNLKVWAL